MNTYYKAIHEMWQLVINYYFVFHGKGEKKQENFASLFNEENTVQLRLR